MKFRLLIIFGIVLVLAYTYNNYFTIEMIEGTYVNKNYEDSNGGANFPDTLKLYENQRFESNYWEPDIINFRIHGGVLGLHYLAIIV